MADKPTDSHHGPTLRLYMVIAVCLALFTAISFVVNALVGHDVLAAHTGLVLILAVAFAKAVLVGMYFMHLYSDWGKLYFLIVPVMILAVTMIIALLPDMVFAWQ